MPGATIPQVSIAGTIPGTVPQQGTQLFSRSSTIIVGTTQIQNIGTQIGLNVWFEVRRSLKPKEPNTCDLKLYNLADTTRELLEQYVAPVASPVTVAQQYQGVPVSIVAGYEGATSQIFLGLLRSAQTMTDGKTTTMELNSGDADKAHAVARSNKSFGTGATAYAVAVQLLTDMEMGLGNIATVKSVLDSPLYSRGVVVKGSSMDLLVDLAASCGLEVTLQGGVPQWTMLGQPLGGNAYGLSSETGLIGSPSVDSKGVLNVETLMLPGLVPGMPIFMQSKYVSGFFRITSMITKGETRGNDWGHSIEATRYGVAA